MRDQVPTQSSQYITFKLGDELFAIEVARVREVLDVSPITRVPTAAPYMRGVVNVRGSAVPVVDLRLKFGLPGIPDTVYTRIVVFELDFDGEPTIVGGLADSVHDVVELEAASVQDPPRIGMRWRTELISGISKHADGFIILLDIDRVFASDAHALAEAVDDESSSEPLQAASER